MKKLSSSRWIMFDMVDVIHMSKISNHYLLEYQTLLDTYEMQAPNVTNGFRVLDFADDISDVEYTSDDWSFGDSYSEASGDLNSLQGSHSEYSCSAGSKPLSLIIRRYNTPVASSSPVPEIENENTPEIKDSCIPPPNCLNNQVQPLSDASNKPLNDGKLCIHPDAISGERDINKSRTVLSHVGININTSELFSSNKDSGYICGHDGKHFSSQKNSCDSATSDKKEVHVKGTIESNCSELLLTSENFNYYSINKLHATVDKEPTSPSDRVNSELATNTSLISNTCTSHQFNALLPPTEKDSTNSIRLENVGVETSGSISRESFCSIDIDIEHKKTGALDERSESEDTSSSNKVNEEEGESHPSSIAEDLPEKVEETQSSVAASDLKELTDDLSSRSVCQGVENDVDSSRVANGETEGKNENKCRKTSPEEVSKFCKAAGDESRNNIVQISSLSEAEYNVGCNNSPCCPLENDSENCTLRTEVSLGLHNTNEVFDCKVLSPLPILKDNNVSQVTETSFLPIELLPKQTCSNTLLSSVPFMGTDCKVSHSVSGPFTETAHKSPDKQRHLIVPQIPSPPLPFENVAPISVVQETPSLFNNTPINRHTGPSSQSRTIVSEAGCSSETPVTNSALLIPSLPCQLSSEAINSFSVDHKLSRPGSSLMHSEIPCSSSKEIVDVLFSIPYEGKLSCVPGISSTPKVTASFSALDHKLSAGACLTTDSWQSDIPFDDIALHAPDGVFPDAAEALDCKDLENSRLLSCSPLLFSSDDESCSVTEEVCKGIELALAPSPQQQQHQQHQPSASSGGCSGSGAGGCSALAETACVLSAEKARVRRLQELLTGAPPPPTVTQPPHTAHDVLLALQERAPWTLASGSGELRTIRIQLQSCQDWIHEASSMPWPQVKCLQHPGIHYNHGAASEQFESLCQKLLARCVGVETASSVCGELPAPPAPRRRRLPSAPRRPSNGPPTGLSPGRRLSHLARRRRAFSSGALLASSSAVGATGGANAAPVLRPTLPHAQPERRTILVPQTRKKTPKQRKSSSKKRGLRVDHSNTLQAAKINSSKRALFQSPTEEERKPASAHSKFRPSGSNPSVLSKRRLFTEDPPGITAHASGSGLSGNGQGSARKSDRKRGGSSRKRQREDSDDELQRLPKRRLFTDGENLAQPLPGCSKIETKDREKAHGKLSATHKKKLLWAVAEALKEKGVGLSHANFRPCATALASRLQRGLVQQLLAERQGSTSDSMLQLARRFVDEALELQGVCPS